MKVKFDFALDDLVDAADVIGMAVRADDACDVLERPADAREVRSEKSRGARMPRIDERDLIAVDEQIRLSADEPHRMDVW